MTNKPHDPDQPDPPTESEGPEEVQSAAERELQEENAETSMDQPST